MLISKKENRIVTRNPVEEILDKSKMPVEDRMWGNIKTPRPAGNKENAGMHQMDQASTYVMSYIATLLAAYESRKYVLDLREIQDL